MLTLENKIEVDDIIKELNHCPEQAWLESKAWSTREVTETNIGAYSKKLGKSIVREQDRLLLIWHKDLEGKVWYNHENYRTFSTEHKSWVNTFPKTMELLTNYFKLQNKKLIRLYFSRLQPGKQIYPHPDEPFVPENNDFSTVQRYGLCVTTNDRCRFTLDKIEIHIPQGVIYHMDNMKFHAATNFGDKDRVHMYMDVIPYS